MACVRKRKKNGEEVYVADWRDALGFRRMKFCTTKNEADAVLADAIKESQQRTRPLVDPNVTVEGYGAHWLAMRAPDLKPRTVQSYRDVLRLHVLPTLGEKKVRRLVKGDIKALLVAKRGDGYSRDSVRIIHATLRAMLAEAVEDGLLTANPADKIHRRLRLVASAKARSEQVKAMTEEQLGTFLREARTLLTPDLGGLFVLLAETGLRIGEALALKPEDFDWNRPEVRIERALSQRGHLDTPKAGYGRTVDLSRSPAAVAAVQALLDGRKAAKVVKLSPWLFSTASGKPYSQRNVLRDMKRVLKRAKLPLHFSLHCLRHTYAAQRIAAGENVYYVARQLGHASTKLTLDTYGRWLPARSTTAAHTVSDRSGDQVAVETVTSGACSGGERA